MGAELEKVGSAKVAILAEETFPPGHVSVIIRGLSVLVGIGGVGFAVAFPLGARPGVVVLAGMWILLLLMLRRDLPIMREAGSRSRLAAWLAVATIPTLWFMSRVPVAGLFAALEEIGKGIEEFLILLPWLLLILGVPALVVLLLGAGGLAGAFAVFKVGEKAVNGLSGAQLRRTLHMRGYYWITQSDAERLLKEAGRAAFHLPDHDHVGTLPGYREGNVQCLVRIVKLLEQREAEKNYRLVF